MQNLVNKIVRLIASERKILEIKNRHNIPTMEWSLLNIQKLGFKPNLAIDVGAFTGEWTLMFKKIFPTADVLMLEAQLDKEQALSQVARDLQGVDFKIGLIGAKSGDEVVFNINSTVSSVLEEYKANDFKKETRKIETLDDILHDKYAGSKYPDFLKIDVQGYELEVLKGAKDSLQHIQFILCEVSLIEINKGAPLLADVIEFLSKIDFVAYDFCSFVRRPLDRALWQTDILFIKRSHPIIASKYWL